MPRAVGRPVVPGSCYRHAGSSACKGV
jgi:hypothetical protein